MMVLMGQSRFESKVISILQEQYEVECLEIDHNVFCRRFDTKDPFNISNVWLPTLMQFADSGVEPFE